jgi:hypothetical protein
MGCLWVSSPQDACGWNRVRSAELHKQYLSHHGRENDFFEACVHHSCKGLFDAIGFIRRLSLEFKHRSLYSEVSLQSTRLWFVQNRNTQVACVRFKMFVLTEWNTCRDGLFGMLCVVWVGRKCMICHHMRTDASYCILTPLRKGDRLLVLCLFSMF